MSPRLSIRPAVADDFPFVVDLLGQLSLPADGLSFEDAAFVVAEMDGMSVGCAGLEVAGVNGLMRSVAVTADRRGLGIGARLVGAIHALATERNLEGLYLLTTDAQDYFARRGYAPVNHEQLPDVVTASQQYSSCALADATAMVLKT